MSKELVKIHELNLRNFKSFRKADIPFADGFTCIVGANGSGKSNILDALLFVFGTQSLKLLRANKLTELVNYNAEDGTARVRVEVRKDGQKYEISRTIDRQGKSIFRLNEKRAALNEIASLLNELGINADGYNIVVQGDITRIIQMNAKERRQIIDDIAGISEFDQKK
ncbi:MAG: AAA family ATPase, partial [Candidatus Diapherotrites archaeon]